MHTCSHPKCKGLTVARGLCSKHYQSAKKSGIFEVAKKAKAGAPLAWLLGTALTYANKRECLLWPFGTLTNGYGSIRYKDRSDLAHRIVCRKAHGKPRRRTDHALHSCGNGHEGCVNPHHLYWGTPKDNAQDRTGHGTENTGMRNGQSKLTDVKVRKILRLIDSGKYTDTEIAHKFGVTSGTIYPIRAGKTWKHIKREAA